MDYSEFGESWKARGNRELAQKGKEMSARAAMEKERKGLNQALEI